MKAAKLVRKKVNDLPQTDNLMEDLHQNLFSYFNSGTTSTGSHLGNVMNRYLKVMEKTSESKDAGDNLKLLVDLSKKTQEYMDGKKAFDADFMVYNLHKTLVDWQKWFYNDNNNKISLLAGRRAGKTYGIIKKGIRHCIEGTDNITQDGLTVRKYRRVVYIGLTIEKSAAIVWGTLKEIIEKERIPVKKIDNGKYEVTFANGNTFVLSGNNSKADREKLRGQEFSMVIIDEMQSQTGVGYLIESIIEPILKGRNGTLILMGTAPLSAGTYWERVQDNEAFSHYHATMSDNPTIPNYRNALDDVLRENGWSPDNVVFRREYLGEIAYDTNVMIYPFRKTYERIPSDFHPVKCYIGLDYGYVNSTAFAPLLINERDEIYLVDEFEKPGMPSSDIIEKAKYYNKMIHDKYGIPVEDIYIIGDTNEPNIARDIYNQGVFNIRSAYKQDTNYQISMVKDALESGRLRIPKDGICDKECDIAVWKVDENGNVIYDVDESVWTPDCHHDLLTAVRYALCSALSDSYTSDNSED